MSEHLSQRLYRKRLVEEVHGPGLDKLLLGTFFGVTAGKNDLGMRIDLQDLSQRLSAGEFRHCHVEDHGGYLLTVILKTQDRLLPVLG